MNTVEVDLVETAEQNVLNRVREAQDWIKIMRILRYAGGSFFSNYARDPGREAWDKGMQMAESALFSQLCMYQADAFMFTGIGGKKSLEWARNKFRERFDLDRPDDGRRHEIMSLLNEYLTPPGSCLSDDEIAFRRQAEQRYKETEKD